MSFGPPIPEIWLFEKKNDLEIQVQGYGWVRRSRSHSGPNNLSTHTFVPNHSSLPFLIFMVFKTLKIQGQGHGWGQSSKSQSGFDFLSTHIPFVPCQSTLSFPIYSFYKIWPWKSKIKVMGQFKVLKTSNRLTFCSMSTDHPIPGIRLFQIWPWKSQIIKITSNILSTHVPFVRCRPTLPFLRYGLFKIRY